MSIADHALLIAAVVCFIVAALPHKLTIRFEWLGAAFWVAAAL